MSALNGARATIVAAQTCRVADGDAAGFPATIVRESHASIREKVMFSMTLNVSAVGRLADSHFYATIACLPRATSAQNCCKRRAERFFSLLARESGD